MVDRSISGFMSVRLEQALRMAALGHDGQRRRSSEVPYVVHVHVLAVAMILDRAGFGEDIVIAGLLHDIVEDTSIMLDEITARFGRGVADLVGHCSEVKTDVGGGKRPWIDRKRDHLSASSEAPLEARAIVLADKLHNLISIEIDLREGRPVWDHFHAEREQVLWYHDAMIRSCGQGEPRLESLAGECARALDRIRAAPRE